MKAGLLLNGSGAIIYLTSHKGIADEHLVRKFKAKGINKFMAYELPVEEVKKRYGMHYDIVLGDLNESDDLRILDYDGTRAFGMFSFSEMGKPVYIE